MTPSATQDPGLSEEERRRAQAPTSSPALDSAGSSTHPAHGPETSSGLSTGGAAVAGAAAGAAIGTAVAGPGGAAVGGVLGAVTGALGGVAATGDTPKLSETSPGPQERDVTRVGEVHREDLRR